MIELLRRAAGSPAAGPAIVTDDKSVSYADLVGQAEAVAGELSARGIERLGVVDHDAADVVALLAGASLVGTEVCLYPPTDTPEQNAALSDRLGITSVASDQDLDLGSSIEVLPVAALIASSAEAPHDLPQQRPLLVLTTGTTGEPKAARHDWSRLLRPYLRVEAAPSQRWLLAYGLHQFGGLQIVLHVMAAAATLVAPAPRRPREGLDAMRRHSVDHASATPTYWRFLLAEMRADGGPVPSLLQITLGGEAVPTQVLRDLEATFPSARVSQVYAANEAGSMRSVRDGRNGLPASVLGERPDADVELKIVDGELWVRSRVGMLGYAGDPPRDPDAWRPTGDLVEVEGDRLTFRGRTTEVINVGGVKVHPLPIEERVSAVPGVQIARVFGRPNALAGAIVAVEIVAEPDTDRDAIDAAVRAACDDLPPAARPRSIRFVASLATTGSKLSRGTP